MADGGKDKSKESLDSLHKLQKDACDPAERLAEQIQALLSELANKEVDELDDLETDLEELADHVEEHLVTIRDTFEEAELNIKMSSDGTDPWTIVMEFRSQKIAMRSKTGPLQARFRDIKRAYAKKVKSIEQDKKTKSKLINGVKYLYNQVKISVEDFNQEIRHNCSSEGKFDDFETMKDEINQIQETVNQHLIALEEKLNKCQEKIENSDDTSFREDCEKTFQREADLLKKEIRSQKNKLEKVLLHHCSQVRAENREQAHKRQLLIDKLTKAYNTKRVLATKIKHEIEEWVTSMQGEYSNRLDTKYKMDDEIYELDGTIETLDEQFEMAKLRIDRSKDVLAENECLSTFRSDSGKIENQIRSINAKFLEVVENHTQKVKAKHMENQHKLSKHQEDVTRLHDDKKSEVESLENMLSCAMSNDSEGEMKPKLNQLKNKLKKQKNDLKKQFDSSLASAKDEDPDGVNSHDEILQTFQAKLKPISLNLDTIHGEIKTINDQLAQINLRKQQNIAYIQTSIKTLYDEALQPANDLQDDMDGMLSECNKVQTRSQQRLKTDLTTQVKNFNDIFENAQNSILKCNSNSLQPYEEIRSKFEMETNRFDRKLGEIYDKCQELQHQNAKFLRKKLEKCTETLKKLLDDSNRRAGELRKEIELFIPRVEGVDEKRKLTSIKTELKRKLDVLTQFFDDTTLKMSEACQDDFDEGDILASFRKEKKLTDDKIDDLSEKQLDIFNRHVELSRRKEEKATYLKLLKKQRDNVMTPAEDLEHELNEMIANMPGGDDLKEGLKQIEKEVKKIMKDFQNFYDKMQLKIKGIGLDDLACVKEDLAEFEKKEKTTDNKMSKLHEKLESFLEVYSKDNQKKKDMLDKLKDLYKGIKLNLCQLQQNIKGILSGECGKDFVDEDDMTKELNKVNDELGIITKYFDDEFERKRPEIESTTQISEIYEIFMKFKALSDKTNTDLLSLQEKFRVITKTYDITDGAVLARSIRAAAYQANLQLEDKNELNIFKLPLQETHIVSEEKLRRFELGQPATEKDHRHIILVGMTGSGKSLLVNNMINYIYGVSYRDKFRFKLIVESEEIGERGEGASSSQADSMTSWVSSFTLHWQEGFRIPYSLTIVDTPGFGDTRGLQYDEEIVGQIRKFFNDEKLCPNQEMSSIGLIIQASQARITEEQKYIFDQVLNLFGKDMEENIFIIFTFADAQPPPALEVVKANKIPHSEQFIFKFNNSAVYAPNHEELTEFAWDFGYTNLKNYFDGLMSTKSISLKLTKQVLDEREQLRLILGVLQKQISDGMETLRLIEDQSHTIVNLDGTIQSKKDFKVKKQTYNCVLRVVSYYITNCSKCNFTCHEPCAIAGDQKQGCASMRNGSCVACPSKCTYDMHTNGTSAYVYTPVVVEETIEDMMKHYNVALGEKDAKKKLLLGMLAKYKDQKAEVFKCIEMANECSNRLEEIALRHSYLTNVEYIERLIQSEERSSRPYKADRLNQLRHLKDMAETLRDVKSDPENLPGRVSDYETKIAEIINTIKDEEVVDDGTDGASNSKWGIREQFLEFLGIKSNDKKKKTPKPKWK